MRLLRYPGTPREERKEENPGIGVSYRQGCDIAVAYQCSSGTYGLVAWVPSPSPILTKALPDFECFTILAQGGKGLEVQNRKGQCKCYPGPLTQVLFT